VSSFFCVAAVCCLLYVRCRVCWEGQYRRVIRGPFWYPALLEARAAIFFSFSFSESTRHGHEVFHSREAGLSCVFVVVLFPVDGNMSCLMSKIMVMLRSDLI